MPLSGARLHFYRAGTTTRITVYQDADATTPHANPVIADASGLFPPIFIATASPFKIVLQNALGITIQTIDKIPVGEVIDLETLGQIVDQAEAAADRAENAASSFSEIGTNFKTVANLIADQTMGLAGSGAPVIVAPGDVVTAQGFRYEVLADDALEWSVQNANSVKFWVAEEYLPVKAFGDDDDYAVSKALSVQDGRYVDFGPHRYELSSAINLSLTNDLRLLGDGAVISYTGGSHIQTFALFDLGAARRTVQMRGVRFDGAGLCNRTLHIFNLPSSDDPILRSDVFLEDVHANNARHLDAFIGGEGLYVQGAFNQVLIDRCGVKGAVIASGEGVPGSVGIRGIAVTYGGPGGAANPVNTVIRDCMVEDVYAEDTGYLVDQDGISVFTMFPDSVVHIVGGVVKNALGRSVKTQSRGGTVVSGLQIIQDTERVGSTNADIDIQMGWGRIEKVFATYDGISRANFASVGGEWVNRADSIRDCQITLLNGGSLKTFADTFPRGSTDGETIIEGNVVYGAIENWVNHLINGNKNRLALIRNQADDIVASTIPAISGERAAIVVRASGSSSPFSSIITATENLLRNSDGNARLVRDTVPSVAASSTVSSWGNTGFLEDRTAQPGASGLKGDQMLRAGRVGSSVSGGPQSGFFNVHPVLIVASNTTVTVPVRAAGTSLLALVASFNQNATALVAVAASMVSVAAGSAWGIGATSDPGTGTFRVWRSGANEVSIRNTDASSRLITVFEFGSGG